MKPSALRRLRAFGAPLGVLSGDVGYKRGEGRPPHPATAPLQNQNDCAIVPPGSGQPVHSASSKPAVDRSTGSPLWTPTAEALREHHRRRQWQPPSRPWGKAPRGDVPSAPHPSGEAWRRSERRCEASSLEPSRSATLLGRLVTTLSRLCHASVTPSSRLVTALSRLRA